MKLPKISFIFAVVCHHICDPICEWIYCTLANDGGECFIVRFNSVPRFCFLFFGKVFSKLSGCFIFIVAMSLTTCYT